MTACRFQSVSNRSPATLRPWLPALLLVLSVILLSACGTPGRVSSAPTDADPSLRIRTEPAPGHEGQRLPLSHPRAIEASTLAAALGPLEFRESGVVRRSGANPIFDQEEIARLAPALAQSLAAAGPTEQVRFASFNQRGGTLGQLRKTEGVAFVDRDGLLNLAFAAVREFAGPDEDFFAFLALTNRDPLRLDRSLVSLDTSAPGVRPGPTQAQRPLWIRLDLAARPAAAPQPALAPQPAAVPAVPAEAPAPAAIPAPAVRTEPAVPATVVEAAPEGLHQQLRERLEFLKSLYEDGLISAEEYDQQRREALRRLE